MVDSNIAMLKDLAKHLLRQGAAFFGPHRWRRGPCLLVLTYHRVLPAGHPARESEQPGMLVSPDVLEMHFALLKRYFTPVHLDDWLRAVGDGAPPPGRSVAITFDDGWRDNYDHAFPVLQAAEMPATLFLVTDMVGSGYRFWPNRLARVLKAWRPDYTVRLDENIKRDMNSLGIPLECIGAEVTSELIDTVIGRCKVRDDAAMHALLEQIEAAMPGDSGAALGGRELLSWDEIGLMVGSGLVRIGSHTRHHTRLRDNMTAEQLRDEVVGSRRILEEKLRRPAPLFCYPNGDHSPRVYNVVRETYDGAVATEPGWHAPGKDTHRISRISIHDDVSLTPASFLARVSGWRGL